jgi:hypothetical protein
MKIRTCRGDDAGDGDLSNWSIDAGFRQDLVQGCCEAAGLFTNVEARSQIAALTHCTRGN